MLVADESVLIKFTPGETPSHFEGYLGGQLLLICGGVGMTVSGGVLYDKVIGRTVQQVF